MNQRTKPKEALGEKPHPFARSSTAPLAGPAGGTDRLPLTAGHSAPHRTSQALKLTSGNGIKSFPRGTFSPLLFLLTTPGEGRGMCVACRSRWQAEELLRLPHYIVQFNLIQYPFFFLAFHGKYSTRLPDFRSWQSNPSAFNPTHLMSKGEGKHHAGRRAKAAGTAAP